MVNWVFIGLIVLAIYLFFKITSFRYEKWWTYSIAIILIFLLFSFFNVVRTNQIDVASPNGFMSGLKAYFSWLVHFGKTTASVTGKVSFFNWNVTGNSSI